MNQPALSTTSAASAIRAAKESIKAARDAYLAIADSATAADLGHANAKVKAAHRALSAAISEGADPCPNCGEHPHGMEQPGTKNRTEYEIGCLGCKPFEHTDGTTRAYRVRGGLLPHHAVEAWNAGPDFWIQVKA